MAFPCYSSASTAYVDIDPREDYLGTPVTHHTLESTLCGSDGLPWSWSGSHWREQASYSHAYGHVEQELQYAYLQDEPAHSSEISDVVVPSAQSLSGMSSTFSDVNQDGPPTVTDERLSGHTIAVRSLLYPDPSYATPESSLTWALWDVPSFPRRDAAPMAEPVVHASVDHNAAGISPTLINSLSWSELGWSASGNDGLDVSAAYTNAPPHAPSSRTRRAASSSPYPPSSPEPETSPPNLPVTTFKRRNTHVAAVRTSATSSSSGQTNRWKCPHCSHVQLNRRSPDLKRHIATHTRPEGEPQWICCGHPVVNAAELGVPAEVIRERAAYVLNGVAMVGGCRTTFSRRDALKRHLRKEAGICFGDAYSLYQAGNRLPGQGS